jgi:hypothetical protein
MSCACIEFLEERGYVLKLGQYYTIKVKGIDFPLRIHNCPMCGVKLDVASDDKQPIDKG